MSLSRWLASDHANADHVTKSTANLGFLLKFERHAFISGAKGSFTQRKGHANPLIFPCA